MRLGGYEREFFITQTPELAAMADAVIDLDSMHIDVQEVTGARPTLLHQANKMPVFERLPPAEASGNAQRQ